MAKSQLQDPETFYAGTDLSPTKYWGHNVNTADRRRPDDGIIDTVAVVRALRGDVIRLSNREVLAAIALGASYGLSDPDLAERLGMDERAVHYKREKHNIPTQAARFGAANRKESVA